MSIIATVVVLVIAFYILVIKGFMWPILGAGCCYFAGKQLEVAYPQTSYSLGVILGYEIHLSFVAATLVLLMTVGFFLKDD